MSFLYPQFLWALSLLAIPVIIHLFNFRRYKTLYFSNNRFLQALQKKSRNFNRLRHLLVLATRLLALALLILAFARPYIPAAEKSQELNYASLFIDNSLSMKVMGTEGPLLDAARNEAMEILEQLPDNFRVQILTNDFGSRQQRFYTPREAMQMVDEIQAVPVSRSLPEIVQQMEGSYAQVNNQGKASIFLLSDFQKSQFNDFRQIQNPNWNLHFVPLEAANPQPNIAVDSVWFDQAILQPGFAQTVNVRLRNYGDTEFNGLTLSLEINDELKANRRIDLQAREKKNIQMEITPPARDDYRAKIILDAGEPYFDNEFYFSYSIKEPIDIHLIGDDKEDVFGRLFSDESFRFSSSSLRNTDYASIEKSNTIILNEPGQMSGGLVNSLKSLLERGGHLIVIPSLQEITATNELLQQMGKPGFSNIREGEFQAGRIAYQDLIFKEVFSDYPDKPQLPEIRRYAVAAATPPFPLLSLENGDAIISRFPIGDGQLILFSLDLGSENSEINKHPLIVPILLNAALYSQGIPSLYSSPGAATGPVYETQQKNDVPLRIMYGEHEIIPRQNKRGNKVRISHIPADLNPGIYPLMQEENYAGSLAININSIESRWDFWNMNEVGALGLTSDPDILKSSGNTTAAFVKQNFQGQNLWIWFIAGALLFLLIEILLLKLWS